MHRVLFAAGICALAFAGAAAATTPAIAGGYGYYDRDDYPDCYGGPCYGRDRDYDRDYDHDRYDRRRFDYDEPEGYYRPSRFYDDYRYRHLVCDPDGDRCYRSRSYYWDYREYYRRHGYRWDD
jgi:hypothetical protein